MPDDWFNPEKCTLSFNESSVALKSEIDKPFKLTSTETTAKTSARDITNRKDAFYFQTDLYLEENLKWYFLLDNKLPENLQYDFQTALKALTDFGIGGERTTGCGGLSGFEEIDFNLSDDLVSQNSGYSVSISLIAPNKNELSKNSLFQIIKRGGRFFKKGKSLPMIQMLLEGAVFDRDVHGRIIELNEDPKVLRYGLSCSIPLHSNFSKF